ncbi:BC1881 family protein [candidate division TA06 bacterium]|nr:BC1881 family protein [candidate division TA06 bacterium]
MRTHKSHKTKYIEGKAYALCNTPKPAVMSKEWKIVDCKRCLEKRGKVHISDVKIYEEIHFHWGDQPREEKTMNIIDRIKGLFRTWKLKDVYTCDLVDELCTREGVREFILDPESQQVAFQFNGPARILEVID